MNLDKLTTKDLLTIPPDQPERLFSNKDAIRGEFRALARRFHPDHEGGSDVAFAHLNALHKSALDKIFRGEWRVPGRLELKGADGVVRRVRYVKDFDVGLGRAYLGHEYVTYAIRNEHADLAESARRVTGKFDFPSHSIRREMALRLPSQRSEFKTEELVVSVVNKTDDAVRLQDLLDHVGGKLDPRHVAWIISELLNLACYLEWAGLTHNEFSADSVFVCPATHEVKLLGGWWYSAPVGARMARLQRARTVMNLPRETLSRKVATVLNDLCLIRLLGRELLGDAGGSRLTSEKSIPPALATWFRLSPTATARQDYHEWQTVLTASFGARRFVKLDVHPSAIYTGAT